MDLKIFRVAAVGAAVCVIGAGVFVSEHYDGRAALDRQMAAVDAAIEQSAAHLTRDLTQEVAVVQGLVALVSGHPDVDAASFTNYTRNFRRGRENLRRVFLVRDGKILFTDRPPSSPESFARIERRLASGTPEVQAAQQKGSVVIDGPYKTTDNDQVLIYARPIFLGDTGGAGGQFWGFAGVNIDDDAITCPLGLCEATPAYRMAVRIVVDDQPQKPLAGDAALFEPQAQVARAFSAIPGARIEIAAMPAAGWIGQAPHRLAIRAVGATLALFLIGLIVVLTGRGTRQTGRTGVWAAAGSASVLLVVLGLGAVADKFEAQREGQQLRGQTGDEFDAAASRVTSDISDDVAVIQNLSTFVEADPNFTEQSFQRYAQRIRVLHPRIVSIQLARDGKISNMSPPVAAQIGTDLAATAADAAALEQSIASGAPILTGPAAFGHREVFSYRQPIYLGGAPAREHLWGIATILIDRDAVLCPLGICAQPPKFNYALRLVTGQAPQSLVTHAPFAGAASMFDAANDSAKVALHMPGGRIELAAIPVDGWAGVTGPRRVIWALAIPLALIAAARLLLMFFGLAAPVVRVSTGALLVLLGAVLALLQQDIVAMLAAAGAGGNALVVPAIVTLIAFAGAYTVNAALAGFVWPEQPAGRIDSMQQAPSILRNFVAILLYVTAGLWVASYAFDLDLHGIGFTSGAAGIIIGFATQKLILDFFSGVMLGIERPFHIGDWVELKADGNPLRGVIYEMTWRTAQIRNANLDLVTIPNSVLAQATVVNRSRPNRWTEITVTFEVGTHVAAALVETTAMNAIEPLIGDILVKDRKPNMRASAIEDGDIHYRLNVYGVLGPSSERPIQDRVVRVLRDAFETAGIEFSSTSATVLQIIAGAKQPDR